MRVLFLLLVLSAQKELYMQTPKKPIPEMVGATAAPFTLGRESTHVSLAVHPPSGPALVHAREGFALLRTDGTAVRVVIQFENITSREPAPDLDVYLSLGPEDDPAKHPELHAGRLPMFGLAESSAPGGDHTENGLFHTLDITRIYGMLVRQPGWDPKNFRVKLVPLYPSASKVRVGRVSLYIS